MPILFTTGILIFFVGCAIFMILLFSSGGASKSRQFEVLRALWSGGHGPRKRAVLLLSLGLVGMGAITCFSGVAVMDAARAQRCEAVCQARGYASGTIGASIDREPATRFVACTCTAADRAPLELRADALER